MSKVILAVLSLLLIPFLVWGFVYNAENRHASLTLQQQRSIFLLKNRIWADGRDINVYSLPPTHPEFKRFFADELHLNPFSVEREWYVAVYSGQGYYPTIVPSFNEMKSKLDEDKDGIGYLSN